MYRIRGARVHYLFATLLVLSALGIPALGLQNASVQLLNSGTITYPTGFSYGVCFHLGEYTSATKAVLQSLSPIWVRTDWYISSSMIAYKNDLKQMGHSLLAIIDKGTMVTGFDLVKWEQTVTNIAASAPDVPAWEIWNEPNFSNTWLGYMQGTPQQYFDMLQIASPILRANGALVVGPCPAGGWTGSTVNWLGWLQNVINLGALDYLDVVSIHLYYLTLAENLSFYNQVKAMVGSKPIWITEMGQASNFNSRTEETQKVYLETNLPGSPADKVFWYELRDSPNFPDTSEGWYGLVHKDCSHKPSYDSFKALLSQSARA